MGAGPAGARAAELLAGEGARVLIWDPKAPWEKPCGGGLPASALRNVPELREIVPFAQEIGEVRIEVSAEIGFAVPLERPLYIVSRMTLGRWQLERARRAGAELIREAVRSIERTDHGWRLTDGSGRRSAIRLLVGADGAASLTRRVASPDLRVELAPTRVAYPSGPGTTPETMVVRFYHQLAGYLWDFPRPDHRSLGIGLEAGTWNRPRMDREVESYRLSREDCECETPDRAGAVIGTAGLGHGDYSGVGAPHFALLGDAAGFADPATGEGIENALRSARFLADAYAADGHFESYGPRARAVLEREFRVSRWARKALFDRVLGARLVRKGMEVDWAYAVGAAVANATNEHDPSLLRLLRRVWKTHRRLRRTPGEAKRGARRPASCRCVVLECAGDAAREGIVATARNVGSEGELADG
ncbi:MAG: hypothetical protein GWM92_09525 [Gemmatimonadetes bacterium]|nr:NAD(P)/FAD-dependent oxidoreductase [Gemmatimonadota bacterium]NIR78902.1 NAD(P)/FAD-dependent oxidoreductase [Gemmatimonadota bacterium]NIT87537.1 NAD(P)/FAD-dependent oxidoreductase [Gemmatimonadota bacterium]NIU31405.1 NAD(P)/FAD-dependent oxidoreductase [Gemmatimonadota bacterium]NIU36090.1 hypothetical protein [Gemmatimonadota bacterium]